MLICRCEKCKGLGTFKVGETLKCRSCGGTVYFLRAGTALPYNTGNALPGFDFAKAKTEWDKLTKAEQDAAVLAFEC